MSPALSGISSESDLISLLVDTDSLADVDDGMASDGDSPNKTPRGSCPSPLPRLPHDSPDVESSRASRAAVFPSALRPRVGKKDYLERASEQIRLAVQREGEQDFQAAFSFYRSGVDLLLQGVQGTGATSSPSSPHVILMCWVSEISPGPPASWTCPIPGPGSELGISRCGILGGDVSVKLALGLVRLSGVSHCLL